MVAIDERLQQIAVESVFVAFSADSKATEGPGRWGPVSVPALAVCLSTADKVGPGPWRSKCLVSVLDLRPYYEVIVLAYRRVRHVIEKKWMS